MWTDDQRKALRCLVDQLWPRELTDARWELWSDVLGKFDAAMVASVVRDFAYSAKGMPIVAEMAEVCRSKEPKPPEPPWQNPPLSQEELKERATKVRQLWAGIGQPLPSYPRTDHWWTRCPLETQELRIKALKKLRAAEAASKVARRQESTQTDQEVQ